MHRFRESFAEDALGAVFQETGAAFLDFIKEKLQLSCSWQSSEVCFFAASALKNQLLTNIDPDKATAANSFLRVILCQLPETTAVLGKGIVDEVPLCLNSVICTSTNLEHLNFCSAGAVAGWDAGEVCASYA